MAVDNRPSTVKWRRLRRKDDTTDDPTWIASMLSPNTILITIGGTASDGDYTFNVIAADPEVGTIPATFERADGESNTEIATELAAVIQGLITDGTLSSYLSAVTSSGAVVYATVSTDSPAFTTSTAETTATGTIVATPDDTWPIARPLVHQRGMERRVVAVEMAFTPVSSADVALPDDNSMTLTVEVVEGIIRATHTSQGLNMAVTSSASVTGQSVRDKMRFEINGADLFGLRLTSLTNTPTSYDALEVWIKEVEA
jgi:hypothetical protein